MWSRRRDIAIGAFDGVAACWIDGDSSGAVIRDELTVTTFNIWFNEYFAEQRYLAIAELLSRKSPDVMVFQEVTPDALSLILAQPWIRDHYRRAEVTGGRLGNYGMLMLARIPVNRVTYTPLPTRLARGFLTAEFCINDVPVAISSIHLESARAAAGLRARQLRRIFRALKGTENVVALGDFNMREDEDGRLDITYCDVWPALRPDEDGFTEDTDINLMRWDSKPKHRQVRFDRVLVKGTGWVATGIELLGTEPISSAQPRVFPSDHFGVECHLASRPADGNLRSPFAENPRRRVAGWWRAR